MLLYSHVQWVENNEQRVENNEQRVKNNTQREEKRKRRWWNPSPVVYVVSSI